MMKPAKIRLIREGIAELFNQADRTFLKRQKDKAAFAEGLAWELANAGYCTQEEYEKDVLPYLLEEQDYVDRLRRTALSGAPIAPEGVGLFSALIKHIGYELRRARQERGWTQDQLAEAAGTRQPVVSRVERGESLKQPTLELLDRFATALDKELTFSLVDRPGPHKGTSRKTSPTQKNRQKTANIPK